MHVSPVMATFGKQLLTRLTIRSLSSHETRGVKSPKGMFASFFFFDFVHVPLSGKAMGV